MRRLTLSRFGSPVPPARWHRRFEAPRPGEEIEVDVGDGSIWGGVRYARELGAFVDAQSGAPVQITMWRYTRTRDY